MDTDSFNVFVSVIYFTYDQNIASLNAKAATRRVVNCISDNLKY